MKPVHLLSTSVVLGALGLFASPAAAQQPAEPLPPSAPPEPAPPEAAPPPSTSEPSAPPSTPEPAPEGATATIVAAPPPVVPAPPPFEPDRAAPKGPPRYDLVRLNAGARIGYLPSRGFDTYASNDVLAQLSIDGTYPLLVRGKAVLAAGLGFDVGGRSDGVRGFESSLSAFRFYVPVEGRFHLAPWLYGFGKIAPGAALMVATVKDGTVPEKLSATGWAFSGDASVGASVLLAPSSKLDKRTVRLWVTPEVGYSFTTTARLSASPGRDEEDVLGSDEGTKLRSLALSGFFWRASVGLTF